jgi:hypothetical protein
VKKKPLGILADIFCARNIVFVAMLVVGGLCIFMSASNTTAYLELTGMAHSIALMTGIALVIFSSTSATAAQLFIEQKGLAKIFAFPFIVVGATVIIFSVFSTLSLNYNKFISSPAIQADMQEKIEKRKAEILSAYRESEGQQEGQDVNQWAMQNIDRLLSMSERSGESWNNSMKTVMETAQNLSGTEQQRQKTIEEILESVYVETLPRTFFGFMLNLRGLEQKYMFDFFMIAIPAIFYDLIAPLAMTVVLFLMGFKWMGAVAAAETEAGAEAAITAPQSKPKEEQPDIKDVTVYIENAMQEEYQILPDDAVPNMEARKCAKFREYLSSFIYKGNPLISERDGHYISIFDKVNLIRFITLQNNVQKITKGEIS